ncbi:hypothetical protein NEMBOFW57_001108 [Staphylotrichum longicolle]|uniref:Myb-like domain-containing protein n=1 Tax=Staphylotrichum longicolle TaxID=669026 RepID=A0AAD4F5E6_9PEZI|nr:hypothetical protein NEMBOFW57_001108 [Staphylotrichum longicolle]
MLPHTVFRPGEALHNLSLPPLVERHSNTDSKLFASSDMLEAMVLDDDPGPSRWGVPTQAAYEGPRCVEVSESDVTSSTWADDTDEKTVSPKMLRLRRTPCPSTSSESLHTSFVVDANHPLPSVETSPCQVANVDVTATKKARKLLPNRTSRPDMLSRRQSPIGSGPPSPRRKLTRLRPKPKPAPTLSSTPLGMLPLSPGGTDRIELSDRMSKDDFLVRQKQMGMTYKEIRRMGGFTEAESTLRGRYRTLTKSREARVRKPEWSEKDLRLLEKAVRALAHTADLNPSKIPWKKVAEHMVAHGGSYHFGNSTCRKRWDELVREQAALGKTVRQEFFEGGMEVGEFEGYFRGGFVGGGGYGN